MANRQIYGPGNTLPPPPSLSRKTSPRPKTEVKGKPTKTVVTTSKTVQDNSTKKSQSQMKHVTLTAPKGDISFFEFSPIPSMPNDLPYIPDPQIEELLDAKKFLFQIERNPSSLGALVFKSYDLFLENGKRIFTIVNRSKSVGEITEYQMRGSNGLTVMTFEKHVATWGDEDCFPCCPGVHESDGIRVKVDKKEVGFVTVRDCSYRPCVFFGCVTHGCCSRYHVRYVISYTDGDLVVHGAKTKGCQYYGLEILDDTGTPLGEISIAPDSNRKVNVGTSPDFMLALTDAGELVHPNGKAVFLGLAIRHQLNVLLTHQIPPCSFKYGLDLTPPPPKRFKPKTI